MERLRRLLQAIDDDQQRHRWLAFPFAVVKKFGDDQAGRHAALLAYTGLLAVPAAAGGDHGDRVRAPGPLRSGRPDRRLGGGPVPDHRHQHPLHGRGQPARGSGLALVVGTAFALWGGLGVADVAQQAMNSIWNVPRRRYPNLWLRRLRGLAWLVLLGGGLLTASLAAGFAYAAGSALSGVAGWPPRWWSTPCCSWSASGS